MSDEQITGDNKSMLEKIQGTIEEKINPILDMHGGSAEALSFDEEANTLTLKLLGGCAGCPASTMTLYRGIVPILQEEYPEIEVVLG